MNTTHVESPFLIPFDGSTSIKQLSTEPPSDAPGKKECRKLLEERVDELAELQRVLYADDRYSVLCIFQAMDAAGKDSTIRKVFTGVNPAGFQVFSFKQPSNNELDHDFLWRSAKRLPQRGRIGVFNRSYYEEVLVVRVHPELLKFQKLPFSSDSEQFWRSRYESIRDHEQHLALNGTVVLKFFLHVSKKEQKKRFLRRLDHPEKHWKFSSGDVRERAFWSNYQDAYEQALRETSRLHAPWYAIPADDKPFMRYTVADIITRTLQNLEIHYPKLEREELNKFAEMRAELEKSD